MVLLETKKPFNRLDGFVSLSVVSHCFPSEMSTLKKSDKKVLIVLGDFSASWGRSTN